MYCLSSISFVAPHSIKALRPSLDSHPVGSKFDALILVVYFRSAIAPLPLHIKSDGQAIGPVA
jgi:hypothetical protein